MEPSTFTFFMYPIVIIPAGYYVDYEFRGRERDVLIALAHASTDSLPSTSRYEYT